MNQKLQSPVVWATVFTVILAQLQQLDETPITPMRIAMSACTVIIAFFGALNNPDDRSKF